MGIRGMGRGRYQVGVKEGWVVLWEGIRGVSSLRGGI